MEHHFETEVAKVVGVEAAVILFNIAYWCDKNRKNGRHFHDGLYWTYNSTRAFTEQFPYLSRGKVDRAIARLQDNGLVEIGNYNDDRLDRTRWYAVTNDGYVLSGMEPIDRLADAPTRDKPASRKRKVRFEDEANEVMAYLEARVGSPRSAGAQHIRARMRDGATVEDCKRVIDIKCDEWGGSDKMRKYLRASTLFGKDNFEKYMDELGAADAAAVTGVGRYAEYD